MVQESLLYHAVIIKIFLWFLILNIALPMLFKKDSVIGIKAVRISVFIYSALLTMVAFTGMILFMLGSIPWSLEMTLMVILSIVLATIETIRIKKLKALWMEERSMVASSAIYIILEISLVALMIYIMI